MLHATIRAPGLRAIFFAEVEHGGVRVQVTFDPYAKRSTYGLWMPRTRGRRSGGPGQRRLPMPEGFMAAAGKVLADVAANPDKYMHT